MLRFQTGDVVCFGDRSWISRAIAWCTRSHGEPRTKCTHVGVMYDSMNICESVRTVEIGPVSPRLEDGWRQVFRPIGLTEDQARSIRAQCRYYRGKSYGWWKNLAHAVDGLLGGVYLARRLCRIDKYPICSWLVAWVYERCVKPSAFGVRPNAAQPDDIHDWVSSHPDEYVLVWSSEKE